MLLFLSENRDWRVHNVALLLRDPSAHSSLGSQCGRSCTIDDRVQSGCFRNFGTTNGRRRNDDFNQPGRHVIDKARYEPLRRQGRNRPQRSDIHPKQNALRYIHPHWFGEDPASAKCYRAKLKCVRKQLIINDILVEAAGVELSMY